MIKRKLELIKDENVHKNKIIELNEIKRSLVGEVTKLKYFI